MSENDLKTLYVEVNTYALASHLFWSLWGLIQVIYFLLLCLFCFVIKIISMAIDISLHNKQAKMSPIDFDYLGYFFLRYNEYKRQKEKLVSMALSYLLERNE